MILAQLREMVFFETSNKPYYTVKSNLNPGIKVAHNIQSLNTKKQALLETWLHSRDGRCVKILCATEHHRVKSDLERISFKDFGLASYFCRNSRKSRGGVYVFCSQQLAIR